MDTKNNTRESPREPIGGDFFERLWEESWTYIKTVVDVVREPILILDKDLRVLAANEPFYKKFQVDPQETENIIVYELGNGQWDIPSLRKLLEEILPKNKFFKGFEVTHEFPVIGAKVMILNARQIHFKDGASFEPIILLAMEDVTEMMDVAKALAEHNNQFNTAYMERAKKLELQIGILQKEIISLNRRTQGKA